MIYELLFQVKVSKAQFVHVIGKVLDCNGGTLPLSTIDVCSSELKKEMIKVLTDSEGKFEIKIKRSNHSNIDFIIGHTGYHQKNITIKMDSLPMSDLEICIERDYRLLEEIIVRKKIPLMERGDTIIFNAKSYSNIETMRLNDLLKNIPGFSVSNGIISFNGQLVETLLLDGDDLAGNNYQMISKNLSSILIDKIKVIRDYNEDQVMGKVNKSGKVAVNIELSPEAKNKLNKNIGLGMGNLKKYHADLNMVQTRSKFKWFTNFSTNSVAIEQDDFNHLIIDENQSNGEQEESWKNYLRSYSRLEPSIPREYLLNNQDLSSGVFFSGKVNSKMRFSGQLKGYQYQINESSVENYTYDVGNIFKWEQHNNYHLITKDKKFESNINLNYNDDDKNHLKYSFSITDKNKKAEGFAFFRGDQNDQYSDTSGNEGATFKMQVAYSRKISKNIVLHATNTYVKSNPSEILFSNSNLYSHRNIKVGDYVYWSQFIGRNKKYYKSELTIQGNKKKEFYSYGIRIENINTKIKSLFSDQFQFDIKQSRFVSDLSVMSVLKYELRLNKNHFINIDGFAGLTDRKWDLRNTLNFNYFISYQQVKKFHHLFSFKLKMDVNRLMPDHFYFSPDSLFVGSGIVLNSAKILYPGNAINISAGINGLDILKQRSWSLFAYFGNRSRNYQNSTSSYERMIVWDVFPSNSHQFGVMGNIEYFIPPLKIKTNLGVSHAKLFSESIVNNFYGVSSTFQERLNLSIASGFNIPINVEFRQLFESAFLKWDERSLGGNTQSETYVGLKINTSGRFFMVISYLQKTSPFFVRFNGLDFYSVLTVSSKMKISLRGHNLLQARQYGNITNGNYGFANIDTTLVGRYVLLSVDCNL